MARSEARRESLNRLEAAQSLLYLGESSHTQCTVPNEAEDMEEETGMATQTELTVTLIEKLHQELDRSKQVISDLTTSVLIIILINNKQKNHPFSTLRFACSHLPINKNGLICCKIMLHS